MRFNLLFDDLEAQLAAERAVVDLHERVEEERLRAARMCLRDRVEALIDAGAGSRLRLIDGSTVELAGAAIGRDWVAAEVPGGEAIVPLASIVTVSTSAATLRASRERMPDPSPAGTLTGKLGIGVVLRDLARRRIAVDVVIPPDSTPLHGTIDRVGSDHFDLAVHERDAARREASVTGYRIVALAAVAMLRV